MTRVKKKKNPFHFPKDYEEYFKGKVNYQCFSTTRRTKDKYRAELIKDWYLLNPQQKMGKWNLYLGNIKKKRFASVHKISDSLGSASVKQEYETKDPHMLESLKRVRRRMRQLEPYKSCKFQYKVDRPGRKYQITTNTYLISKMTGRIRILSGGARAGKTASAFMSMIVYLLTHRSRGLVCSMTMPALRASSAPVFVDVMHDLYGDGAGGFTCGTWSDSILTFRFTNGSILKFQIFDKLEKSKGVADDIIFLNEAKGIPEHVFDALNKRVRVFMFVDYNPTGRFYIHNKVIPNYKQYKAEVLENLNLLGNEGLTDAEIYSVISEMGAGDDESDRVYIFGELGDFDIQVYKDWQIIAPTIEGRHIPHDAQLISRGVDFGVRDPTAIVAFYRYKQGVLADEEFYQNETLVEQIGNALKSVEKHAPIVADKSGTFAIQELRHMGVTNIRASKGGAGSILDGIRRLKSQKIWVTERSVNLIHEKDHYSYKSDGAGGIMEQIPKKQKDHALDALRYAAELLNHNWDLERAAQMSQYNRKYSGLFSFFKPSRKNDYNTRL